MNPQFTHPLNKCKPGPILAPRDAAKMIYKVSVLIPPSVNILYY